MKVLIVIPARYASTRFPGKPLEVINGKSMISRVWEKCVEAIDRDSVLIATDDKRILDHCEEEGMKVIMTSKECKTGTDRIAEVALSFKADTYINVQGDEPMISSNELRRFIKYSQENPDFIINAMTPIRDEEEYIDSNVPKVVINQQSELLYMSRSSIPGNKEGKFNSANKQVCIYAFPKKAIYNFGNKKTKTTLEEIEDIEILRFLESGYKIKMFKTKEESYSVDTPKDLERVRRLLK